MSSSEYTDDYLLRLFRQDIQQRLVAEAKAAVLPAIEASIEAAAKQAVQSMEVQIRKVYDARIGGDLMTVLLKINDKQVPL